MNIPLVDPDPFAVKKQQGNPQHQQHVHPQPQKGLSGQAKITNRKGQPDNGRRGYQSQADYNAGGKMDLLVASRTAPARPATAEVRIAGPLVVVQYASSFLSITW